MRANPVFWRAGVSAGTTILVCLFLLVVVIGLAVVGYDDAD
jgi:hypothetical protein